MPLEMKTRCGKCGVETRANDEVYICSYECTFCSACAAETQGKCPNCSGELVRRPRRAIPAEAGGTIDRVGSGIRPWLIWAVSFGVWMIVTVAGSIESYQWWLSRGNSATFASIFAANLCELLTYAPLTPVAFVLATRFSFQRENWVRRSLQHLALGVAFCIAHVILRGLTPYAIWDSHTGNYASAVWNSQTHVFQINWQIFKDLFRSNIVEDVTGAYIPIVLVAHALSYYRSFRDRELHSAKLESQLATAHLQALKSHLQPHFLFNTMHSISALMLIDVKAADKMMARLSDLLRMSLESDGAQIIRLSRELEFVNGYLEIEKIRLRERLNVVLDIAPETLDALVPSLLLQPLVENAIRHGISRVSSGGTVWITSSQQGSDLWLRVRDNGPGLVEATTAQSGTGLGLRTTRERLQTIYGDDHSFEIRGGTGGGMDLCLRLPFRTEFHLSENGLSLTQPELQVEG
jgi:two-component system LytT family sensor kinase